MKNISRRQENPQKYDDASVDYSKIGVPGTLPSMYVTLDKFCGFRSGLFRRRLNAELLPVVVFLASLPTLFDLTSYTSSNRVILNDSKPGWNWAAYIADWFRSGLHLDLVKAKSIQACSGMRHILRSVCVLEKESSKVSRTLLPFFLSLCHKKSK